jgi:hypothetical protein
VLDVFAFAYGRGAGESRSSLSLVALTDLCADSATASAWFAVLAALSAASFACLDAAAALSREAFIATTSEDTSSSCARISLNSLSIGDRSAQPMNAVDTTIVAVPIAATRPIPSPI